MAFNNLEYALARMAELKPKILELDSVDGKLSDEQRAQWVALTTEWDELDERRQELEERARRATAASSVDFSVIKKKDPFEADLRSMTTSDVLGAGRTVVERMSSRFARSEHANEVTAKMDRGGKVGEIAARMALTTGSDEYRENFFNYMAQRAHDTRLLERANDEYRAMTAGTGSSGGYMVPLYLDPTMVITGTGSFNPFRQVSNVKTIGTLTYNGATAAQVTAGLLGENAAYSDNTPTVSQVQIPTYKIGAYVPASFEAFEDIDALASDVQELFADAKDNYESAQMATGSGSAPHGVITDVTAITASRVSPATGGAFVLADAFSVHSALPPRFWRKDSLAWVGHVAVSDKIRTLAMAQNSANSVWTDIAGGTPPQFLGDPFLQASGLDSSFTTGPEHPAVRRLQPLLHHRPGGYVGRVHSKCVRPKHGSPLRYSRLVDALAVRFRLWRIRMPSAF
jgi:HK97 family phage major capsid protein